MVTVKEFSECMKEWTSMLNAADPMFPVVIKKLAESGISYEDPDMVAWMVTYETHIKPILLVGATRMKALMENPVIKDLFKE